MSPADPVVVVGGGLAGAAAAAELASRGARVELHERRKALGGRASSFRDPAEGRLVDNGQHVLLGVCRELRRFLDFVGAGHQIAWRDDYHLWCPGGPGSDGIRGRLSTRAIPFHRARSLLALLRLRFLSWGERWSIARALAAAAALREPELAALEAISFEEWLRRAKQPPRAVSRFFGPILVSALNESIDRSSAAAALGVLRRGFLGSADDMRLGVPRVPLAELFDGPVQRKLGELGVSLFLGSEVERIELREGRACGVAAGGASRPASAVVLAGPWTAIAKLVPKEALEADPQLSRASALEGSPIVSAHFFFGPEVAVPEGELALVESRAQWVFDRFAASGRAEDRGHLVIVVSAARELARLPRERIERELLDDLRAVVPGTRGREPRRALVVTEWEATYSAAPGTEAARPKASTRIPGLFLAGDACATGWPATMEGAVRSGAAAARALLDSLRAAPPSAGAIPSSALSS